jgi:predicted nucleotidyltransferase
MATHGTEAQGQELLAATVDLAQELWRDRLLAAYALGSLAHGGFRPLVSDIDIGFVLADPLLPEEADAVERLVSTIKAGNRPFADRLSIFWGSVSTLSGAVAGGRFPPLDRLDLMKFGRLVRGLDVRSELTPPTLAELVIVGAEFALWRLARDDVTAKLKDPRALAQSDAKTLTKLILYPVRFMYTARTGEVGRNEAAVEHLVAAKESASSDLARFALDWRSAIPTHSDKNAIQAIAAGVLPLYDEFLMDYEPRLREYGRLDLAEKFQKWRLTLQA